MNELIEAGQGGLRFYALADRVLDDILTAALERGIELPARRFVVAGEATFDCEQVFVAMQAGQTGMPGAQGSQFISANGCTPSWMVDIRAAIVRCAPSPARANLAIDAAKLSDSLRVQSKDAELLMEAVDRLASLGFGNVTATITFPEHQGLMHATVVQITMGLP